MPDDQRVYKLIVGVERRMERGTPTGGEPKTKRRRTKIKVGRKSCKEKKKKKCFEKSQKGEKGKANRKQNTKGFLSLSKTLGFSTAVAMDSLAW